MIATAITTWSARRVLVTGATGFVGSHLVRRLLEQGAEVTALVRDHNYRSPLFLDGLHRQINIVSGGLEDYQVVERAVHEYECNVVFHLAAQAIVGTALRSPRATFESNIRGTYNLLDACRVHAEQIDAIVVASSDKAYGHSEQLPYTEQHALAGRHPYDVSKSCTDLLATSYHETYDLPVAIARCGNIYGGGDLNWSRLVPGTIQSLLNGDRPIIRSNGKFVRDYLYVADAVLAYVKLAEQIVRHDVRGHAFNFSTGLGVSVLAMVNAIQTATNAHDLRPRIENSASAEIAAQTLDTSRAHRVLQWQPRYDLHDGLAQTVNWYQNFFAAGEKFAKQVAE